MSKVFGKSNGRPNKVRRVSYDLTKTNHLTTKFGQLTPVLCLETNPGESFRIRTRFGVQFMPTYFPVQVPMRVDLHYFYVRNRNLWKGWKDFIGKTKKGLVSPYLADPKVSTGSIYDYLGVPSTSITRESLSFAPSISQRGTVDGHKTVYGFTCDGKTCSVVDREISLDSTLFVQPNAHTTLGASFYDLYTSNPKFAVSGTLTLDVPSDVPTGILETGALLRFISVDQGVVNGSADTLSSAPLLTSNYYIPIVKTGDGVTINFGPADFDFVGVPPIRGNFYVVLDFRTTSSKPVSVRVVNLTLKFMGSENKLVDLSKSTEKDVFKPENLPLSALPFRAYESIYNSFYRDDRNNPRLVDGVPEYNEFLTTNEGGADSTDYHLFFRNWEQDQFTTAVPRPQQGDAPLVGISSTGVATFVDPENPDKFYSAQLTTAEDGNSITGFSLGDAVPGSVRRSLVNVASSGISINDFRNVNAFQRWLETNIRRGLKYKDQIKSHFDVDVSYQELDMPEFIGGVSERVQVAKVDQTSAGTDSDPLGSFAGQAYAVGQSRHEVTKYCDEHGWIIGVMSVVPVPVYNQVLPRYFTHNDTFDYFFPEFGHIGLQPILNREVAPVQAFKEGKLDDVFGYQRPWYWLMSSLDESHGDFRTDLRDFILSRQFSSTPQLGQDFTVIDPSQLNHIFSYTRDTDKIMGMVQMAISAKRPVPMYGVPMLESPV